MDIFTIGHSTHSKEQFILMLQSFDIQTLADVRSFPGSRHMPHFNKEVMQDWLAEGGIQYVHIPKLGGRRRNLPEIDAELISGWRHIAFRNYSAYSLTEDYSQGLNELMDIAKNNRVCIMCAEGVPWRCHRMLVSNSLSFKGFTVHHIMATGKADMHKINKYGAVAVFDGKNVIYPKPQQ